MILLKNIRKMKDSISADYYLEGKDPRSFMKIRISDGMITEHENPKYGYSHAKNELERLAELENPPTERTVLWY